MDGREPQFTLTKGLAATLVFLCVTETTGKEDLTGVSNPVLYIAPSAGAAPLISKSGTVGIQDGSITIVLEETDTVDLETGTYVATIEASLNGRRYTTQRLYAEVQDRVGGT
jgi:hypothetical protein